VRSFERRHDEHEDKERPSGRPLVRRPDSANGFGRDPHGGAKEHDGDHGRGERFSFAVTEGIILVSSLYANGDAASHDERGKDVRARLDRTATSA
jgi:hypothetical protein